LRLKSMKKTEIILKSLIHSLSVAIYVFFVGLLFRHGNQWFGKEDKFLTPVAMLLLFILSAAITGSLVLAKPILLFLDKQKTEALSFFLWTLVWLFILTIFAFLGLLLLK